MVSCLVPSAKPLGDLKSSLSQNYLLEKFSGVDNRQFLHLLNVKKLAMSKKQLSDILSIAQSDRERECIRYTAVVVLEELKQLPESELLDLIRVSHCNWFEVVTQLEETGRGLIVYTRVLVFRRVSMTFYSNLVLLFIKL